ncbi:unnamed protein product [Dicrocoelium dendriticum]|nr:unnamed protein product [Dicrocoelium dendriticum]
MGIVGRAITWKKFYAEVLEAEAPKRTSSIAKLKRNGDIGHPCRTPLETGKRGKRAIGFHSD